MGILYQYFGVKDQEILILPIEKSVWYDGETVSMRIEQWTEVILDFAQKTDPTRGELLIAYYDSREQGTMIIPYSEETIKALILFFTDLCKTISSLPEDYFSGYETDERAWYSNRDYIDLLKSVQAVFSEALRLRFPVTADIH